MITTPLCTLLGIEHPILNASMAATRRHHAIPSFIDISDRSPVNPVVLTTRVRNHGGREVTTVPLISRLLTCLILFAMLGFTASEANAQAAASNDETLPRPREGELPAPHVSDEVPIFSMLTGEHVLTITVIEAVDDHPIVQSKLRGNKIVALHVIVTNESQKTYTVQPDQFWLIDDVGTLIEVAEHKEVNRNGTDTRTLELTFLEPRGAMSGWVFFSVPEQATPIRAQFHGRDRIVCYGTIANFAVPAHSADGAALILDQGGNRIGSIKIDRIINDFDLVGVPFLAAMDTEIIALELTVTNEGTSNWQFNSNTIGIGDQFGRSYGRVNCDRTAQSLTAFPELPEIVEAGETRTGVVAISVWPGAELVDVFFVVGETRMFVIGHADPAITIGADEAREMVARSTT